MRVLRVARGGHAEAVVVVTEREGRVAQLAVEARPVGRGAVALDRIGVGVESEIQHGVLLLRGRRAGRGVGVDEEAIRG